jgi:hypothetical protein
VPDAELAQDPLCSHQIPDTLHSFLKHSPMLDTELLFRYECEGLDTDDEVITLFQQIYDTQAYKWLQGHYGRMLQQLIEEDLINL